jgi:nucleotide-binding universal stress UspA family protein
MTVPGRYQTLVAHIEVHRYFMGLEQEREIAYKEAVRHWYDEVYLPVVRVIRERGILRDFPERTEADLYVWLAEHRAELEKALGWEVEPEAAAADLSAQFSPRPGRRAARVGARLLDAVTPDALEAGPSPGRWREERIASRREDRLFAEILAPIAGEEAGWQALEQALGIARRENARLRGLHIVPHKEAKQQVETQAVQARFERRCEEAGVRGQFALEVGGVARAICERARWADLVVVGLAHPPGSQPVARLSSGFRTLLRRCPRPVLAVPGLVSPVSHPLLAYDGSLKAEEALFIAAYLASRWQVHLTVVTVLEDSQVTSKVAARPREYLEGHGVQATYLEERGPASGAILGTAEERACDLILMGGYGHSPVVELVWGSTLDQVLRQSQQPILISR